MMRNIRSYIMISIGLFMFVFAWTAFLIPSGIIGGGVSGISSIIYFATGIPVGVTSLALNGILVVIAIRVLGANYGISTIYGIAFSGGLFIILQQVITAPLVNDPFMCAMIGGMLSGFGVGLAFSNGGNSGGTDIIALIVSNYYNISPGRVIIYIDVLIIASSYLLFHSIEKIVYGYVVMGLFGYTVDMAIEGSKQTYQILVFSKKHKEIADKIGNELGRGITFLQASGWYTGMKQEVLLVIAHKRDRQRIVRIIHDIDSEAFTSLSKANAVYGKNFDRLKI